MYSLLYFLQFGQVGGWSMWTTKNIQLGIACWTAWFSHSIYL